MAQQAAAGVETAAASKPDLPPYLVSRDIRPWGRAPLDVTPDHEFVAIFEPKTGQVDRYCSYGPSEEWGGQLVSLPDKSSATGSHDRLAMSRPSDWDRRMVPIPASVAAVAAACDAMNQKL